MALHKRKKNNNNKNIQEKLKSYFATIRAGAVTVLVLALGITYILNINIS